jgi:hypothetical protein
MYKISEVKKDVFYCAEINPKGRVYPLSCYVPKKFSISGNKSIKFVSISFC